MPPEFHHDVQSVREIRSAEPPALVHPGWAGTFPWLVQGTTTRGDTPVPFDLGLYGGGAGKEAVRRNWSTLRRVTGARRVVHARQLHGSEVRRHDRPDEPAPRDAMPVDSGPDDPAPGDPVLVAPCDGHVTAEPGVLLAVTTADCVPVFAVDAERRVVGLFHAGWRGAADGVLERGLEMMRDAYGSRLDDVHLHLGPAICGVCYEVGREVFEALGREPPATPAPIDLRRVLAQRAVAAGVTPERTTLSWHCTRCTGSELFSHRAGDGHRQVGYLGVRS